MQAKEHGKHETTKCFMWNHKNQIQLTLVLGDSFGMSKSFVRRMGKEFLQLASYERSI